MKAKHRWCTRLYWKHRPKKWRLRNVMIVDCKWTVMRFVCVCVTVIKVVVGTTFFTVVPEAIFTLRCAFGHLNTSTHESEAPSVCQYIAKEGFR
jgi:hypothetical protein